MTGSIGIFDSGYGGLTVLRELVDQLPEYSYLYLGDNAREPYGPRSEQEIFNFTLECVEYLFAQGCPLVILACNTSSANALRRIQQEVLPEKYPDRRVLGVLAPAVEEISGVSWNGNDTLQCVNVDNDALTGVCPTKTVGIIGTPATIASKAYTREIKKRNDKIKVFEQACPNLATLIVTDAPEDQIRDDVRSCLEQLYQQMRDNGAEPPPDSVLIGCTHYALVKDIINDTLPTFAKASVDRPGVGPGDGKDARQGVKLIDQGPITANRLRSYLERHPEITSKIQTESTRQFLTTDDPEKVSELASRFYGKQIKFEQVKFS